MKRSDQTKRNLPVIGITLILFGVAFVVAIMMFQCSICDWVKERIKKKIEKTVGSKRSRVGTNRK